MKKSDRFWLSAKCTFARMNILFLIGIAAAVYCWCVGGGLVFGVQDQISQPYELNASAGSSQITEKIIAQTGRIPGVLQTSAGIEILATLTLKDKASKVTVDGIDPEYLQKEIIAGTIFPQQTVMPYVALNEAALKQLQDKNKDGQISEDEKIDWTKSSASLTVGQEASKVDSKVASKICGIVADGNEDAKAYVSLATAQKLAGTGDYTACLVRIQNVNRAKDVSDKISALGLAVQDTVSPQQSDWDRKNTEAVYLILLGCALLFYSAYLFAKDENLKERKNRAELEMLRLIGMNAGNIQNLFIIKNVIYCCIGFGFGVLFYWLIPQFLSPELQMAVNIAYPFNTGGVLFGASLCAADFLICFCTQKGVIKSID
jgi:ABC-type lipoprotein release transport system permease subunit